MGMTRKPDNEVTAFALYYREYRKAKKEGKEFKRGRHRILDESKLSQNPHAKYMRNYNRNKTDLKYSENKNCII